MMADIVFLSHTTRLDTFRVGSHHLSREFAKAGHRVAHITTPFSALHRLRGIGTAQRRRAADSGAMEVDGVMDLVPSVVLPADVRWTRSQYRSALREVGLQPEYVFIDQPLFRLADFGAATVIFRPTDLFGPRLAAKARQVAGAAHGIAATSPRVLEALTPDGYRRPTTVIENGVEYERFAAARSADRRNGIVYVGALDERFDWRALIAAAASMPGIQFDIYGPTSEPPPVPSNIRLQGPLAYEALPDVLGRARVGLLPFVASASNEGRSPMKLFEYVAAGLSVVAPTPIAHRARGLSALYDYAPGDRAALVEAIGAALAGRGAGESDFAVAESMDWSRKSAELLAFAGTAKP